MPEKIGTVLNRVLKHHGLSQRIEVERLFNEWNFQSHNTILNFCHPEYVEGNILYIKARDDQWHHALKGKENEIFTTLEKRFLLKHIRGIIIIK